MAVQETGWEGECVQPCCMPSSCWPVRLTCLPPLTSSQGEAPSGPSSPPWPKQLCPGRLCPRSSPHRPRAPWPVSLRLPDVYTRPACGGPLRVGVGCQGNRGLHVAPSPGAIDLAAKSAGIIPGSPLPVLDTDGLSGIAPLSSDEVTAAVTGPDSTGPHQNGDPLPAVGVSVCRGLLHAATSSRGGTLGSSP